MTHAFRSITTTLAIVAVAMSRPVIAQSGSTSLTHLVSVTVQPRVKVLVGGVGPQAAAPVAISTNGSSARGLALSVNATRTWVLLIDMRLQNPAHSLETWVAQPNGASSIQNGAVALASDSRVGSVVEASVFLGSADSHARSSVREKDNAVVLTMVAP